MTRKKKGSDAERELISLFWDNGWAAIRAAGSGSTRYPCADLVAGNRARLLAIECKLTKDSKKYVKKEEIEQLREFSSKIGAEPWLALKFPKTGWFFLSLDDLEEKNDSFAGSVELAKTKGLGFNELIERKIFH